MMDIKEFVLLLRKLSSVEFQFIQQKGEKNKMEMIHILAYGQWMSFHTHSRTYKQAHFIANRLS